METFQFVFACMAIAAIGAGLAAEALPAVKSNQARKVVIRVAEAIMVIALIGMSASLLAAGAIAGDWNSIIAGSAWTTLAITTAVLLRCAWHALDD